MVVASQNFNDTLSFTDLSKFTLSHYSSQYANVYYKGALNGMIMDIMLLDLSDGKYGVQELLGNLSDKYGQDKPFKDDELINEVEDLTYPEIGEYLNKYIVAGDILPYQDALARVGYDYSDFETTNDYSLGRPGVGYNPDTGNLYVSSTTNINEFGKSLGYKDGDIFVKLNDVPLSENVDELQAFFEETRNNMKEGESFSVTVKRKNEVGIEEEVILESEIFKVETTEQHIITPAENPTERQLMLRKAWLKPRG